MRYYYDCDYDKCLTEDELKAEFAKYSADGLTEAESADDYIYNFLDYSGIEITEKIYNEFGEAEAVRQAIKNHIASYHASWNVVIADDDYERGREYRWYEMEEKNPLIKD